MGKVLAYFQSVDIYSSSVLCRGEGRETVAGQSLVTTDNISIEPNCLACALVGL